MKTRGLIVCLHAIETKKKNNSSSIIVILIMAAMFELFVSK